MHIRRALAGIERVVRVRDHACLIEAHGVLGESLREHPQVLVISQVVQYRAGYRAEPDLDDVAVPDHTGDGLGDLPVGLGGFRGGEHGDVRVVLHQRDLFLFGLAYVDALLAEGPGHVLVYFEQDGFGVLHQGGRVVAVDAEREVPLVVNLRAPAGCPWRYRSLELLRKGDAPDTEILAAPTWPSRGDRRTKP